VPVFPSNANDAVLAPLTEDAVAVLFSAIFTESALATDGAAINMLPIRDNASTAVSIFSLLTHSIPPVFCFNNNF
jgi:hypothetical protein